MYSRLVPRDDNTMKVGDIQSREEGLLKQGHDVFVHAYVLCFVRSTEFK